MSISKSLETIRDVVDKVETLIDQGERRKSKTLIQRSKLARRIKNLSLTLQLSVVSVLIKSLSLSDTHASTSFAFSALSNLKTRLNPVPCADRRSKISTLKSIREPRMRLQRHRTRMSTRRKLIA